MKRYSYCLTILIVILASLVEVSAQVAPLKEGDKFPERVFKMLNYKSNHASFSEFKGKAVILAHWATWCTYCIAGMPKLHEFQEKYKDRLQILLVNKGESKEKIERFIEKRKLNQKGKITLPVVYGDSVLSDVMLGHYLPTYFWIDPTGVYRFNTNRFEITEENVHAFLETQSISSMGERLPFSTQFLAEIQKGMPGLIYARNDSAICWQSTLKKTLRFSLNQRVMKNSGGLSALYSMSSSISDLYRFAYGEVLEEGRVERHQIKPVWITRTLIEGANADKIGRYILNYTIPEHLYSYELFAPNNTSAKDMQAFMRTELDKFFGLRVSFEKRRVKCMVLHSVDTMLMAYKGSERKFYVKDMEFHANGVTVRELVNLSELMVMLGQLFLPQYPLVDQTGFNGRLGINIEDVETGDVKKLAAKLKLFGVDLRLEDTEIEVMVLRQKEI